MHARDGDVQCDCSESHVTRRDMALKTGRKALLVVKGQRTPLDCVLRFGGRRNLRMMTLDI